MKQEQTQEKNYIVKQAQIIKKLKLRYRQMQGFWKNKTKGSTETENNNTLTEDTAFLRIQRYLPAERYIPMREYHEKYTEAPVWFPERRPMVAQLP